VAHACDLHRCQDRTRAPQQRWQCPDSCHRDHRASRTASTLSRLSLLRMTSGAEAGWSPVGAACSFSRSPFTLFPESTRRREGRAHAHRTRSVRPAGSKAGHTAAVNGAAGLMRRAGWVRANAIDAGGCVMKSLQVVDCLGMHPQVCNTQPCKEGVAGASCWAQVTRHHPGDSRWGRV
jgi:hypothetical protein